MEWEKLLSLKRHGDEFKRKRIDQDETRLGFDVDYDRIIFSSEFRSLQDKTQVVPFSQGDFVHTRLTHSLETSVVGRSLGRRVGVEILKKYQLEDIKLLSVSKGPERNAGREIVHLENKNINLSNLQYKIWEHFFLDLPL